MIGRLEIVILVVAASLASGCAPPTYRTHPDLLEKANNLDRVLILPPRVEVFLIHASGVKEKMDEWTEQAKGHVMEALEGELRSRSGLLINTLSEVSLPKEVQSNLEETQALLDVVDGATTPLRPGPIPPWTVGMASEITMYAIPVVPEKLTAFSYTLGSEVGALDEQADALVLVRGVDHISSVGRKILMSFMPFIMGIAGADIRLSGETTLGIALVDARSGDILWYDVKGPAGIHDLREADSATSLVKALLEDFPIQ